jgi:hypothetical protein
MMAGWGGPADEVVRRLASDPRMREVWDELNKHQRQNYVATDKRYHASRLPKALESWRTMAAAQRQRATEYAELDGGDIAAVLRRMGAWADVLHRQAPPTKLSGEEGHELALVSLFVAAVATYLDAPRTVSQKEVDSVIAALEAAGKESIAAGFRRHAAYPRNTRFIVARHRTEPRVEAFVETVRSHTQGLFGTPLYGVIATIANVAFERCDLTRQKIRALL